VRLHRDRSSGVKRTTAVATKQQRRNGRRGYETSISPCTMLSQQTFLLYEPPISCGSYSPRNRGRIRLRARIVNTFLASSPIFSLAGWRRAGEARYRGRTATARDPPEAGKRHDYKGRRLKPAATMTRPIRRVRQADRRQAQGKQASSATRRIGNSLLCFPHGFIRGLMGVAHLTGV
jgi:hypothetical protein